MRNLATQLLIAWDGTNWIDETAYLASANGSFRFSRPADFLTAGGGTVDTASFTLTNVNNHFISYINAASFFQRHVRLSVDVGNGWERIFSGAIDNISLQTPNTTNASRLTLNCVTQEGPYLQRKFNLTLADFRDLAAQVTTEVDWFNHILDTIGAPLTRVFDPGMIAIPWLWADDESVLEEMWAAAAAAGGVLFTNVDGHLVYRNASTIAKNIANPVETLSRTADAYGNGYLDLTQEDLYSDVTIEVSTRVAGAEDVLWSPGDYENLIVPADGTLVVVATYDDPVYQITRFEWEATDASGYSMMGSTSLSRNDFAQKSELTFANTNGNSPAYIRYFRIYGFPIIGGPAFERTVSSSNSFWVGRERRYRSVRENAYIQTPVQAKFLADIILDESDSPRPLVTLDGLPGKPSRFVGDVVRVQDSKLHTADIIGQIETMSWNLSTTFEQSITVRDFGGIYECAPYFVLDADNVGSTKGIFY